MLKGTETLRTVETAYEATNKALQPYIDGLYEIVMASEVKEGQFDVVKCGNQILNYIKEKNLDSPNQIAMLACADEGIKGIFETNPILLKKFNEDFASAGYRFKPFTGMNGASMDIFHQYLAFAAYGAAQVYSIQEKHSLANIQIDLAANSGSFFALEDRCKATIAELKKKGMEDDPQPLVDKIEADLQQLANLYWQVGYIKAAELSIDAAAALAATHPTHSTRCSEKAIRSLICARYLRKHDESKEMVDWLSDGKGLSHFFKNPQLKNLPWSEKSESAWNTAESVWKDQFGINNDAFAAYEAQAKNELSILLGTTEAAKLWTTPRFL